MRRYWKQPFIFSLKNPSPDEEREIDLGIFVDEEGDIDDESDVELDGNGQLDLDLDSEHNSDLESDLDLLADSEDRAGSAEEFQWSPTLPQQVLSLRILIY